MFNPLSKLYTIALLLLLGSAAGAQDVVTSGIPRIVITKDEIQRQNIRRLDQLFDGQIPGIVAVDRGTAQTTSMRSRGVSSFSVAATPRIYLNEVPLDAISSLSQIAVESVDSVVAEVGAAAGTLIGAGATGGVVRIYTKRGRVNTSLAVNGKISGGLDQSLYGRGNKFFQDHIAEVEGGRKSFTYYTGLGYGSEADWAPNYSNRYAHVTSSLTGYSRYGSVTIHGRLNDRTYEPADFQLGTQAFPQHRTNDLRHYTYGVIASSNLTSWWKNEVFYGIQRADEQSDQKQAMQITPSDIFSLDESVIRKRTSIVYHTSVTLPKYGIVTPSISASYDRSRLHTKGESDAVLGSSVITSMEDSETEWEGVSAKLGLNVGNRLVLNAGARRDTKDGGINDGKVADPKIYPRYDAAYTTALPNMKDAFFTLRGAHGRVANPMLGGEAFSVTSSTFGTFDLILANPNLEREVLWGNEAGVDLSFRTTRISATVFEQKGKAGQALVIVDEVPSLTTNPGGCTPRSDGFCYFPQFQTLNVVDVRTQGFSASFRTATGPWALMADYTTYLPEDEKVADFISGYDRRQPINDFPSRNGHAAIAYTDELGTLSFDAKYVGPHNEGDYTAATFSEITYPGFVTYDLNMSKPMGTYGTFLFFVHNLAGVEHYGLYNDDYVYGRRYGIGLRFTR